MLQISSLKTVVDDEGGSRKMVETLTAQNLELKKKVRKLETSLGDLEASRDVMVSLDDAQKKEITGLKKMLDNLEMRFLTAQEENSRLDRSLQIEHATLERYKGMVDNFKEQADTSSSLASSDRQGFTALELARIKRAQEASLLVGRSLTLQLELQRLVSSEFSAKVERLEAMTGAALGGIFGGELRWLAADVMMMEGISKAGMASKQLLINLPLVDSVTDEHKMYAAVLRVSVHVDVCVDLLKGLSLALIAAGNILNAPPSEGNDFVPIISAVQESAASICAKLEAEGDLSSREDIQRLATVTNSSRNKFIDQPIAKRAAEPYSEADLLFIWELLVQLAYYVGSMEAIAIGSRAYYRLTDGDVNVSKDSKPHLATGLGLADAIIASSINISEEPAQKAASLGATGDAAWRSNGISSESLALTRNDALAALQKLSSEYSVIDKAIDQKSKPNSSASFQSLLDTAHIVAFNKALEAAHTSLSKIIGYTKKVGIKIPRITNTMFGWGLLAQGLSFEVVESGALVKSFVSSPCNWRARADKIAQRIEAVLSKENAINEMQVGASQASSVIAAAQEERLAAVNRVAELDNLLNLYIEKNAALEQTVRDSIQAMTRAEQLDKENRALKARLDSADKSSAAPVKVERRAAAPVSSVPVSAVALEAALEVTRAWRSVARQELMSTMRPVYKRAPCITPLSSVDSPAAVAFQVQR